MLQHSLLVASLLQLSDSLPHPGHIFSTQTFLSFHKAAFKPYQNVDSDVSLADSDHLTHDRSILLADFVSQYQYLKSMDSVMNLRTKILNCEDIPIHITPLVNLCVTAIKTVSSLNTQRVTTPLDKASCNGILLSICSKCPQQQSDGMSITSEQSTGLSPTSEESIGVSPSSFVSRFELSGHQDARGLEQDWYTLQGIQEEYESTHTSTTDLDPSDDCDESIDPPVTSLSSNNSITNAQTDTPLSTCRKAKKSKRKKSQSKLACQSTSALPILEHKDAIIGLVHTYRVVMIEGETGCGKSTKVPQFILDSALQENKSCVIMITQPRRVAAIKLAERVACERSEALGQTVGYCIKGECRRTTTTALTYCTIGYLLQVSVHVS